MNNRYTLPAIFLILIAGSVAKTQTIDNFTLKNTSGADVSLSSFATKKAVVVIFSGNHCVYSKKYLDRINALEAGHSAKGVQFIMINSNDEALSPQESLADMKILVETSGVKFPYLKDGDKAVAKKFSAEKNPEAFVLKPSGATFTVTYRGLIDDNPLVPDRVQNNYLEQAIAAVLGGQSPANAKTDAVGCAIK